jgi:hypothetical protein
MRMRWKEAASWMSERVERVGGGGVVADPLREALLASHDLCSNPWF